MTSFLAQSTRFCSLSDVRFLVLRACCPSREPVAKKCHIEDCIILTVIAHTLTIGQQILTLILLALLTDILTLPTDCQPSHENVLCPYLRKPSRSHSGPGSWHQSLCCASRNVHIGTKGPKYDIITWFQPITIEVEYLLARAYKQQMNIHAEWEEKIITCIICFHHIFFDKQRNFHTHKKNSYKTQKNKSFYRKRKKMLPILAQFYNS